MQDDELVMSLVEKVLDQPAEDRERYARVVCDGDDTLFEEVWRYVTWDERMKGFLLEPVCRLPADEPALEPGEILEHRFRIIRRVAAGGMGVVYEAWDQKLDRRIAIKCAKAGFHARLSPEVRHASDINHPNVCKTWDIHTASAASGDFDFLTMEFIEGETLAERLREGALPDKEARSIANQLCAGLAEAHRRQVIHGDLKSSNVLLAEGVDGARAAITDFGLARSWMPQDPSAAAGELGGTLDYMAPELLRHGAPSIASDIYALGVILHEIAVGHAPFASDVPVEERLVRRPALLSHAWSNAIARCLETEPARRWASVPEVAKALVPFPRLRVFLTAAAVVLAIAAGAFLYSREAAPAPAVRLAILPFAADAGSKSLSDGLLQDTADRLGRMKDGGEKLTVIPHRDAIRNRVDAPERAAALLGATHTLSGTITNANHRVSIHAVLTDARTRLQLKQWDAEYEPGELGSLPMALAGIVTGTLRLPPLAYTASVNAQAYPDFAQGLGSLQVDKVDAALPFLTRAVALDPGSPLTHARLAEAQARKYRLSLGAAWLGEAHKSLQKAQQLNPDLPMVWIVSGRIKEFQGLYEDAESDYKRALEINPLDGDAWRRLGRVYQQNNQFPAAVTAFKKAIEMQPNYFPNYQDLCALNTEQARYSDAVPQCRKFVQLVPDLSDAHFALAIPLFCLGKRAEAETESLRALQLDPKSVKAILARGFALTSEGRPAEAIPLFLKAIEIGPANCLMYCDLGTAYRLAGNTPAARKAYAAGLDLAEHELEKNPRNAIVRAQLAYVCARLGEGGRARSEIAQAHQMAPNSVEVAWWAVLTWDALKDAKQAIAVLRNMPEESLRRLSLDADLAELRRSSRFKELLVSRNIQPQPKE